MDLSAKLLSNTEAVPQDQDQAYLQGSIDKY